MTQSWGQNNMKKNLLLTLLTAISILILAVSCQPISRNTQRATATAYAVSYMADAMAVAESSALALCNIDFKDGKDTYIENICAATTALGCKFFTRQVEGTWNDLDRTYSSDRLGCVAGTSRFLEEGTQFGMRVQYWQVNLQGTEGWGANSGSREYWLQVAEENSSWKLNRVLTGDEVAFYLTIEAMAGEK
jgi:hypothetical protein